MSVPSPLLLSEYRAVITANWCGGCSPLGHAHGEPGCACERCGRPVEVSDMELSATRSLRNRVPPR